MFPLLPLWLVPMWRGAVYARLTKETVCTKTSAIAGETLALRSAHYFMGGRYGI